MSLKLLVSGGPLAWAKIAALLNSIVLTTKFSVDTNPAIADGLTDGKLKTVAATDFHIAQWKYSKAATDDLWDLSAETDTTATQYRAYWLYLDSAGVATIVAGTTVTGGRADALAGLPIHDESKSIAGCYVADPSTDFNGVAGLAAQGTVYNGIPEGAWIGIGHELRYEDPQMGILATK